MFHEVNCSNAYVIYLMECTLYKKQCVGKSETSFNIRLNYYHKDVKKPEKQCFQQTHKAHHYR